jgi:hydrogenase expression/formation protein HypD
MNLERVLSDLRDYPGKPGGESLSIMEVCGTHTAAIFRKGIRDLISPKIRLISGPGCPVCVTPTAYIDRCMDFALRDGHVLLTFGDMMKVPGTEGSLSEIMGKGANVRLMYSPFEALDLAAAHPDKTYAIAAVGFETTVPAYGLLLEEARNRGIGNIRLVTALKTVLPALEHICAGQPEIDGFIMPGHVSVITGTEVFEDLARRYRKPLVVAGFEGEHILAAIHRIITQVRHGEGKVENAYPGAVRPEGNPKARAVIDAWFEPGPAMWRGLGIIPDSGLYLREGDISRDLTQDKVLPAACRCGEVITGRINPDECPMFGQGCDPAKPYGPCMVSAEGACGIWYRNRKI